jgi:hypothetical protein
VHLDAVVVTGASHCRADPAAAPELVAAWEEVRRALTLSDLAGRDGAESFELRVTSRIMTGRGEVAGYTRRARLRARAVQPWTAPPAERLAGRGWVERAGDSLLHHGPSVATLLSDEFVGTHCFSLVRDGGRVGIAFAPTPGRATPDVAGTIWLDAGSSELRRVDFTFTNVADSLGNGAPPDGTLEFERLPTGRWYIRRWSLRVPIMALSVADPDDPDAEWERRRRRRARSRMDEPFRESVGEAVVLAPGAPADRAGAAIVAGVVVDSTSGEPLSGVQVLAPGALVVETDAAGRYALEIGDAPDAPTDHAITFVHPTFAELGLRSTSRVATLRAGTTARVDFGVPSVASLLAASCPLDASARDAAGASRVGMLVGTVLDADGAPVEGSTVEAEWAPDGAAVPIGDEAAVAQLRATTARADGGFHLCPLPLGREVVLRALRDGAAVAETRIVLPATGLARYTLVVEPEGR